VDGDSGGRTGIRSSRATPARPAAPPCPHPCTTHTHCPLSTFTCHLPFAILRTAALHCWASPSRLPASPAFRLAYPFRRACAGQPLDLTQFLHAPHTRARYFRPPPCRATHATQPPAPLVPGFPTWFITPIPAASVWLWVWHLTSNEVAVLVNAAAAFPASGSSCSLLNTKF